ncbi:hypothetical protein CAPTEDRAFT_213307 [Capitella teleta]|uniref:Amino acid transporter transmembrane domain-containing protein n=1 Tax=Capitella teleta TaxID=283909 RepID=R7UQL2_CAPTE|nr:hypothetical protein CAPTEDRAFT_213307 [Capitella teleta]|eukprot:ELU08398.1 hypothetical protein CAPTEDRAFT_213307 [Capitella teleta]
MEADGQIAEPLSKRNFAAEGFNFVRSIIGCGILVVPFAFTQTGVAGGVLSLVVISLATIFASEKLIKVKYCAISILCTHEISTYRDKTGEIDNDLLQTRVDRMQTYFTHHMKLQKIGELALSTTGSFLLRMGILLNRFGVAISCHILFGTTLYYTLYPEMPEVDPVEVFVGMNDTTPHAAAFILSKASSTLLIVFVLVPLPIYLACILVGRSRCFSPLGITVTIVLVIVVCIGFVYSCIGFQMAQNIEVLSGKEIFIGFAGMLTAFDIIPIVIPLEEKMYGANRIDRFKPSIRAVVGSFGVFVLLYGTIGYLAFGSTSNQLLSTNFEIGIVSYVLDGLLLLLASIAYVVPITPVLAYVDVKLFSVGAVLGPKEEEASIANDVAAKRVGDEGEGLDEWEIGDDADGRNILEGVEQAILETLDLNTEISKSVALWKRLVARASVVIIGAGLAILMRDFYAYFMAFVGAATSAPLLFIAPAYLHLALDRSTTISRVSMAIDVAFIVFGLIVSIGGVTNKSKLKTYCRAYYQMFIIFGFYGIQKYILFITILYQLNIGIESYLRVFGLSKPECAIVD